MSGYTLPANRPLRWKRYPDNLYGSCGEKIRNNQEKELYMAMARSLIHRKGGRKEALYMTRLANTTRTFTPISK